jgi:hypothetical protein
VLRNLLKLCRDCLFLKCIMIQKLNESIIC